MFCANPLGLEAYHGAFWAYPGGLEAGYHGTFWAYPGASEAYHGAFWACPGGLEAGYHGACIVLRNSTMGRFGPIQGEDHFFITAVILF